MAGFSGPSTASARIQDPRARHARRVWLLMGPSQTYPRTCYILAAAPSYDAAHQVTRQLMEVEVDGDRLGRYAKPEARAGPPLDFGNP